MYFFYGSGEGGGFDLVGYVFIKGEKWFICLREFSYIWKKKNKICKIDIELFLFFYRIKYVM